MIKYLDGCFIHDPNDTNGSYRLLNSRSNKTRLAVDYLAVMLLCFFHHPVTVKRRIRSVHKHNHTHSHTVQGKN